MCALNSVSCSGFPGRVQAVATAAMISLSASISHAGEPISSHSPPQSAPPQSAKLDPLFAGGKTPAWSIVSSSNAIDPIVAVYVLFSDGVPRDRFAPHIERLGGALVSHLRSIPAVVAHIPRSSLDALSAHTDVRWVETPLPLLSPTNADSRVRTQAGLVQSAPYSLDGTGITALVYDGGFPLLSHVDFAGRLTTIGSGSLSTHATHTTGSLGGSGVGTTARFHKGMAPNVRLLNAAIQSSGGGLPLYNNPADLEADYSTAINTHNADLTSNSLGTNVASNNQPCSLEGNYGITDAIIDNVVRGSLGRPIIVVWAAGNERDDGRCGVAYNTIAPPAGAKNPIVVGAINSNDDSMTAFSGWGPTDDGRLKPDLVAPGCQTNLDRGITSCSASDNAAYDSLCGTSMACPTVAGLAALILQDYRAQFPSAPRPPNSLIKLALVHGAADILLPGPDYQSGYGSARVKDSIDFLRADPFHVETITTGESRVYEFQVLPREFNFKATLVWDDPAGVPLAARALVNDLDLIVTDPNGQRRYPWTLNPAAPATAAAQTDVDRLNNIEQVFVESPMPGTWTIEVRGHSVPQPGANGQQFSLGYSTRLCACDWNAADGLNSQDYYDFLHDFFAGSADFNGSGETNADDFFTFLQCYVAACN